MDSVDNAHLEAWIKAAGYSRHPFDDRYLYAEDYAEDSDHLEKHFTAHTGCFQAYMGPDSTIIVGTRGSGKTANCIKLGRELSDAPMNFVLTYDDFDPVRALAALNYPLLKLHMWQIVRLGIETLLSARGDQLPRMTLRFLTDAQRDCDHFQRYAPYLRWLNLWREAVLSAGYDHLYLLIDERRSSERGSSETPTMLEPLLDGDLLSLGGLSIKLFVPDSLEEAVRRLASELKNVSVSKISWAASELYLLLQSLLSRARSSAQPEPFGHWLSKSKGLERITRHPFASEIDNQFIEELDLNGPTPRNLVQLGRLLFEESARSWEPSQSARIDFKTWAAALERWLGNLNINSAPIVLERIKLRFAKCEIQEGESYAQIFVQESPHDLIRLPYSPTEVWSVLWALERYAFNNLVVPHNSPYLADLMRLKLLQTSAEHPTLIPDLAEQVGTRLYECLAATKPFTRAVEQQWSRVQELRSRAIDARIWLDFRFDPDATHAASYPWELICHQRLPLLLTGNYELTRYMHLDEDEPALEFTRPFTLFYTAPRAGRGQLTFDRPCIEDAFRTFGVPLHLRDHNPATFDSLRRIAGISNHQAWHYDGHGTFRRWCSDCNKRVPPWPEKCEMSHFTEGPFGYLQLETTGGRRSLRKATEILPTFYGTGIQLAFVNGCKTSTQAVAPTFGGIAPALIRARIPAVVAMLLSIADPAAELFVCGFYRALAKALEGGNLSGLAAAKVLIKAVSEGRQCMLSAEPEYGWLEEIIRRQWFIPVIHLRAASQEIRDQRQRHNGGRT